MSVVDPASGGILVHPDSEPGSDDHFGYYATAERPIQLVMGLLRQRAEKRSRVAQEKLATADFLLEKLK